MGGVGGGNQGVSCGVGCGVRMPAGARSGRIGLGALLFFLSVAYLCRFVVLGGGCEQPMMGVHAPWGPLVPVAEGQGFPSVGHVGLGNTRVYQYAGGVRWGKLPRALHVR